MSHSRSPHPPIHASAPTWRAAVALALVLVFEGASLASAQEIGGTIPEPPRGLMGPALSRAIEQSLAAAQVQPSQAPSPDKRWGHAVLGTIGVNVVFNLVNLAFRPDAREEFKVTPKTWWDNLKYGMIFDDNNFATNQFGHPYQGNLYFNAGRAYGLNYWESGLMAALGSFTWECCGETNRMSINDFFSTTLGGMIVGEVTHRMANLVLKKPAPDKPGTMRRITALALDPIGATIAGINDTPDNPPARLPGYLGANVRLGAVWRGAAGTLDEAKAYPELEFDFLYGDSFEEDSHEPFDTFWGRLRLGGGGGISELFLRGRLVGRHVKDTQATAIRFEVNQGFEYVSNPAYELGAQAVYLNLPVRRKLSETTSLTITNGGFILPLGAISAEYVDVNERSYDYGPGGGGFVSLQLNRRGFSVLSAGYAVFAINTVNGSGGSHVAQLATFEGNIPISRKIGLGASYRYFQRNSFYVTSPDTFTRYPEGRVYMIWRLE